ncbi:MAG TPA: metalloregulator ArsR/SmtB family transcription factor [Thermomicrobiales bacterium]|nr:metalloregulator ArsR/SmtB family transcription factor [Thermomicrobiales bacterium]
MGKLVVGTPALRVTTAVSLPLDLVSFLSLLYRAVPGSGLDRWLIATREALPADLRADLDLLHGFSGRMLYYPEEPVMRFEPLRADRQGVAFDELQRFLEQRPPADYQAMAAHALERVHADLGLPFVDPVGRGEAIWRQALAPCLTTADPVETLRLLQTPEELKRRTVDLFVRLWRTVYQDEYERRLPELIEAAQLGRPLARGDLGVAFCELTGNRTPSELVDAAALASVTFCPSAHLGDFVSYIHFAPDLVVFYDATSLREREGGAVSRPAEAVEAASARRLPPGEFLEIARALADANRLRVLDLLAEGELYAQEIVGRLGIAQSAVSRHLAQLERAGLVDVHAHRGMKYYAVNVARFAALADAFRDRAGEIGETRRSVTLK